MSYPNWGNIKMKGKPQKLLRCRCCVAWNKKRFPSKAEWKKTEDALGSTGIPPRK